MEKAPLIKGSLFILIFSALTSLFFPSLAQLLTLLCIFLGSFYCARKIKRRKILAALLVPLPAFISLQFLYYLEIGRYFPLQVKIVLFSLNFLIVLIFAALAYFLATFRAKRKIFQRAVAVFTLLSFSAHLLAPSLAAEEKEIKSIEEFVREHQVGDKYSLQTQLLPPEAEGSKVPEIYFAQYSDLEKELIEYYWDLCERQKRCDFKESLRQLRQHQSWQQKSQSFWEGLGSLLGVGQKFWASYRGLKDFSKIKYHDGLGLRILKGELGFFLGVSEAVVANTLGLTTFMAKTLVSGVRGGLFALKNPLVAARSVKEAVGFSARVGLGLGKIFLSHERSLLKDIRHNPQNLFILANPFLNGSRFLKNLLDTAYPGGSGRFLADAVFSPEAVEALKNGDYGYAMGRGMTELGFTFASLAVATGSVGKIAKIPKVGKPAAQAIEATGRIDGALDLVKLTKGSPAEKQALRRVSTRLAEADYLVIETETITVTQELISEGLSEEEIVFTFERLIVEVEALEPAQKTKVNLGKLAKEALDPEAARKLISGLATEGEAKEKEGDEEP